MVRYDQTCRFCRRCAALLAGRAGTAVRVEAASPLDALEADLPDGRRLRGARAASEALWRMGGGWRALALAARLPGAELAYRAVARLRRHL